MKLGVFIAWISGLWYTIISKVCMSKQDVPMAPQALYGMILEEAIG
ncbi:hypothetical protein CACET_c38970 [Clostridium aceticum]|uniref:Uncharacterized protein n=1 Tax=Clostridium aceticum TaxID=84022 RepID=A0A0G3WHF0_9CLOT|nr:hypothetical protein [Clostridium aceticum]AKL97325.1 hypothetical protein CACET_c38970 [Clostridium aceticum]